MSPALRFRAVEPHNRTSTQPVTIAFRGGTAWSMRIDEPPAISKWRETEIAGGAGTDISEECGVYRGADLGRLTRANQEQRQCRRLWWRLSDSSIPRGSTSVTQRR